MRSNHFWIGMASTVSVACAIFAGCGSSSSGPDTPAVDSGADVTAMDAAPDTAKADTGIVDSGPEACAVDADLATLPVPDASLNDAGATAAGCVACVNQMCPTLLSKCQMSCGCVTAFVQFETCIGQPGAMLLTCASPLLTGDTGLMTGDVTCALGCEPACGAATTPPTDGGDGGDGATADGDDGSTDAAGE